MLWHIYIIIIYTYNAWTVFNCVVMVFRLQQLQQRKQRCLWKRQRPRSKRSKSLRSLAMLAILSWFVSSLCFVCLRQGRRERVVCCPAVRSLYFHLLGPDIQKTVNISGKRGSPAKERGRQGTFYHFAFFIFFIIFWLVASASVWTFLYNASEMLWNQSSSDSSQHRFRIFRAMGPWDIPMKCVLVELVGTCSLFHRVSFPLLMHAPSSKTTQG